MTETSIPRVFMPSSGVRVAWLDHENDRRLTGNVHSRYGAQLRQHASCFRIEGRMSGDRAHFAATAWQLATTPELDPPFLRLHPRVLRILATPLPDQSVKMSADLVSTLPERMRLLLPRWTRSWRKVHGQYAAPTTDPDSLTVLPVLTVEVAIPTYRLPTPTYHRGGPDRATAIESLEGVCDSLGTVIGPILEMLRRQARPS